MFFSIQELSLTKDEFIYALVHYWVDQPSFDKGEDPVLKNDFKIQPDPDGTEETERARVIGCIERFWDRKQAGDFTSKTIKRDPEGAALDKVVSLRDYKQEVLK